MTVTKPNTNTAEVRDLYKILAWLDTHYDAMAEAMEGHNEPSIERALLQNRDGMEWEEQVAQVVGFIGATTGEFEPTDSLAKGFYLMLDTMADLAEALCLEDAHLLLKLAPACFAFEMGYICTEGSDSWFVKAGVWQGAFDWATYTGLDLVKGAKKVD